MRSGYTLVAGLSLVFELLSIPVCSTGSSGSRRAMPAGSFLAAPATSPAALYHQVRSDSALCSSYARLYQISPGMVRLAFSQMRLGRFQEERVVRVYYYPRRSRMGYFLRRIHRGTRAFVLPDGSPALLQACGNPIKLVVMERRVTGRPALAAPKVRAPEFGALPAGLDYAPLPIQPVLPAELPEAPEAGFVEVTPGPPPPTPEGLPPAELTPIAVAAVHRFAFPYWLLPFGLLPLLGGSGHETSVPPIGGPTPPPVGPPPPAVPEPGALALTAAAATTAAMALALRRRRRA